MKRVFVLLSCLGTALGQCSVDMPYAGMAYLTPLQLSLYKLTDPCSVICKPGYFGDFCDPIPDVSSIPRGPWNVPGYYTSGAGKVRDMALSLTNQYSIVSFTNSDSTLVGLFKNQLATSTINLISLSSQTVTPILSVPYMDALQVRYGKIFVAKSADPSKGPFDISVVSGPPYTLVPFMAISLRASRIEIFQDKGMSTAFVFSTSNPTLYQLRACYPNGVCDLWFTTTNSPISAMACGMDCPNSVFVSWKDAIYKVSSTTSTQIVSSPPLINCMASSPFFNTLIYRTGTSVLQLSLGAKGTNLGYPVMQGVSDTGLLACSLDISDSNVLIMLVENGLIRMAEAVQRPCPDWQTSKAVVSTSVSACSPCPAAPANGHLVPGSSTCAWRCLVGFRQLGSQCVALPNQPCPKYFYDVGSGCLPSGMPWAPGGSYRVRIEASPIAQARPPFTNEPGYVYAAGVVIPPYVLSIGERVTYAGMSQNLYVTNTDSTAWRVMTVQISRKTVARCGFNSNNHFYYLTQQGDVLWVGFFIRTGEDQKTQQHCLWGLDTSKTATNFTQAAPISAYWSAKGPICSASGDGAGSVYLIQCGTNYISKAPAGGGDVVAVAGQSTAGYLDGGAGLPLFRSPSSLVYYNQRLFVTDTGNCVLREVDLLRGKVSTVAGMQGVCERMDGGVGITTAGLAYPVNLTLTSYPGFFLFMDKGVSENRYTIRQYHADSGSVITIQTSIIQGVTSLASLGDRIYAQSQSTGDYYKAFAATLPCPTGSISNQGGATSADACTTCSPGSYANGSLCLPCSSTVCTGVGQRVLSCQGASDAQCGACANKPEGSVYTGPAEVYDGYVECPWVYVPPCPIGFYANGTVCAKCPAWSTSPAGSTSIAQCLCRTPGAMLAGSCVILSPYNTSLPNQCAALTDCASTTMPEFPFPLIPTCTSPALDSYEGVCVCLPGEYISQVYPKVCRPCPHYLYSPDGITCLRCPPYAVPTLDKTGCRCFAGAQDASVSSQTLQCVCGPGHGFSVVGCVECPVNTISPGSLVLSPTPWLQSKECTPCPAGTYSGTGQAQCESCPGWQYREDGMQACSDCPSGQYALEPSNGASCTACVDNCGGRKRTPCPTDPALYVCTDCPAIRANASYSGADDCATSCWDGYYELDLQCAPCSLFTTLSCPPGNFLRPCGGFYDSECLPCVNASKPDFYSKWHESGVEPSRSCTWECVDGYQAKEIAPGLWECSNAQEWSVWDIFTV